MASNYTTNYQLNQWEAGDQVLRTEFNQDNQKIDRALKSHDDEIAALEEQLDANTDAHGGFGNCTLYYATYAGTGTLVANSHTFPGKPMLIMVADGAPGYSFIACRGMSEAYHYYQSNGTLQMALTWSDRTVTWQNGGGLEYNMNAEGHTYHIVALLQAGE